MVSLRPQDTAILTTGIGAILIDRATRFVGSHFPIVRQSVPAPYGKAAETFVGGVLVYLLADSVLPAQYREVAKDSAVLTVAFAIDHALTAANILNFEDFEDYYAYSDGSFAEIVPEEKVQSLAEEVPETYIQTI